MQPSAESVRLKGMTISLGLRASLAAGIAGVALAAVPAHAATTVIHFPGLHVVHDRATARTYLPGTPRAFRLFAAHEGAAVRRLAQSNGESTHCVAQAGITVTDFAQAAAAGYAIGGVGSCGGYAALWTNATRGAYGVTTWREVIGTQDGWYCPDLKRYRVPSALVGTSCYSPKLRRTLPYHVA